LFGGAGQDEKWARNGLRKWVAHGEAKVGYRREREGVGRKERIVPKGLGKKLFPIFKTFYKFQTNLISIQI
jgi:hypothetical protein